MLTPVFLFELQGFIIKLLVNSAQHLLILFYKSQVPVSLFSIIYLKEMLCLAIKIHHILWESHHRAYDRIIP